MARTAEVVRNTKETQITVSVDLDGTGVSDVETGVGYQCEVCIDCPAGYSCPGRKSFYAAIGWAWHGCAVGEGPLM